MTETSNSYVAVAPSGSVAVTVMVAVPGATAFRLLQLIDWLLSQRRTSNGVIDCPTLNDQAADRRSPSILRRPIWASITLQYRARVLGVDRGHAAMHSSKPDVGACRVGALRRHGTSKRSRSCVLG